MSKHTPEPWELHYDENSGEWPMIMAGGIVSGKIVANVNPSSFCIPAHGFVDMPSLDNARRIVACVNACRGLPTDELEQKGLIAAVGAELLELDCKINEMADLLRDLRPGAVIHHHNSTVIGNAAGVERYSALIERIDALLSAADKQGGAA